MNRTFVYIDGFNLYHGAVRPSRTHWLNLARMCELLLQVNQIDRIKYFTAMVADTPDDCGKSIRQQIYHRALQTLPNVEIIKGQFRTHQVSRSVVGCKKSPTCFTRVFNREEKSSDVNLAAHLIHDGHRNLYDVAVVISGDSDLTEPIKMVVRELKKAVGVINPRDSKSKELSQYATFYKTIRAGVLHISQFPEEVVAGGHSIKKPCEWSNPKPTKQKRLIHETPCPDCTYVFSCATLRLSESKNSK